jgi:hypothetical protein
MRPYIQADGIGPEHPLHYGNGLGVVAPFLERERPDPTIAPAPETVTRQLLGEAYEARVWHRFPP